MHTWNENGTYNRTSWLEILICRSNTYVIDFVDLHYFGGITDHQYYKKNGLYDFPQKKYMSRLGNLILMLLSRIPPVRKEIYTKRMMQEMIKPLQKVLDRE